MPITINGTSGISGVDGTAGTPALQGTDTNTGISFGSDVILGSTGGTERFRCDSSGRLLVGTSSASGNNKLQVSGSDALINSLTVGRGNSNISDNTAFGVNALVNATNSGYSNTAIGHSALTAATSATNSAGVGRDALKALTTGGGNSAFGTESMLSCTTGNYNLAVGILALKELTTGSGNLGFGGFGAGQFWSPVFNVTTQSSRVVMGDTGITNAYVQVAWTVTSDARDKMNFGSVPHGLEFVKQLNPISFQFKKNRDLDEPHGPLRYGFKAQDILALEGEDNAVIIDNEDSEKLRYNGETLVPVLVNAIKEQQAIIEALEARVAALESA